MKFFIFRPLLIVLLMISVKLSSASDLPVFPDAIRLQWRHISNQYKNKSMHLGELTILNDGDIPLPNKGWALYFNWFRRLIPEELDTLVSGRHINGDFYEITPTADFPGVEPGGSVTFSLVGEYYTINETDAPSGSYFVWEENKKPHFLQVPVEISPFDTAKCYRSEQDIMPVWNPEAQYQENKKINFITIRDEAPLILPSPVEAIFDGQMTQFSSDWQIDYEPECLPEVLWFQNMLAEQLPGFPAQTSDRVVACKLKPEDFKGPGARTEAYRLHITTDRIEVTGFDNAGLFYGLQTILALLPDPSDKSAVLYLPECQILDYPRFGYRGMHIDVARNFHDEQTIEQMLKEMARYKLNRLHFHITDDEGWRLEIPGLPELTEIGSVRAHTVDEATHLVPSLGSGPFASDTASAGSGYYSREAFIGLLKYAARHHIKVIPEIDLPGHAHAAIVSMHTRYQRLKRIGMENDAIEYLLYHPQDTSQYLSVQKWKNNTVDVGLGSTYHFFEKVVREIRKMYEDAGLKLQVLHIGGDEVPEGAWRGSPACQALKQSDPAIQTNHDLLEYFVDRLGRILEKYDIRTAGWEEIGIKVRDGKKIPNKAFAERGFIPHVWNSVWGWGGEDLAYRLANQGFDVVLSNATNLYFGLAHNKHPEEPGLYWAGFVSLRNVWEFTPTDVKRCAEKDLLGRPIDAQKFDRFESLSENAGSHLIGLQGHIWSENARSKERLHYFVFPKLLAMAERAWSGKPAWEQDDWPLEREDDWHRFISVLGYREFPRLAKRGIQYRIPSPGAIVRNDTLYINNMVPGLTTCLQINDGSVREYRSPVLLKSGDNHKINIWNIDSIGRKSRMTVINPQ